MIRFRKKSVWKGCSLADGISDRPKLTPATINSETSLTDSTPNQSLCLRVSLVKVGFGVKNTGASTNMFGFYRETKQTISQWDFADFAAGSDFCRTRFNANDATPASPMRRPFRNFAVNAGVRWRVRFRIFPRIGLLPGDRVIQVVLRLTMM